MIGVRSAAVLLALAATLPGTDLASGIRAAIESSAVTRTAFWGIQIVDVASGNAVYQLNRDCYFVPASNTKLFTTALALARLGPDYRFDTRVLAARPPDAAGTLDGDLRLVGGGDPNLSGRAIPYRPEPVAGDPLEAIGNLADQVAEHGVKRVAGDIVGDDTAYLWEPYPEGWAFDDATWDYGAPVSALTLNDNSFTLTIQPGARAGDLAAITIAPPVECYGIDNRVRTTARGERQIHIERQPGSGQLRIWGNIPLGDKGDSELLGVGDPAWYAARAFYLALERRGIVVEGDVRVRHLFPNQAARAPLEAQPGIELAWRTSAPLIEDLRITSKVSQNLHAELLLRAVGLARRGTGSRRTGLEELQAFLDQAGVARDTYVFQDGSGLDRRNLVTPGALVRLLRYMWNSPMRDLYCGLLPVAGRDGTLSDRFSGTRAAGRIRAKTGSMAGVSTLSGYAARPGGETWAFAILVNNYRGEAGQVRAAMDRICNLMVE